MRRISLLGAIAATSLGLLSQSASGFSSVQSFSRSIRFSGPRLPTSKLAEDDAAVVDKSDWEGWTILPEGVKYKDTVKGSGDTPNDGGSVTVNYVGRTSINGRPQNTFDDSYKRGYPFKFVMGQGKVISGWELGLKDMTVGSKRTLVIPPELAYGDREVGNGIIPANSELCFECELLEVGPGGQGAITLAVEDFILQMKIAFSNKFFAFFFVVWFISFIIPNEVYKQIVSDIQSRF
jgi:peptidylprolyl isomerase